MTAPPRGVMRIQSPWRQTPGIHREVALAAALAVGVAPEEERHRGHRLGDHELADLVDDAAALLVPGLDRAAERAALQLALVDRQQRAAGDERRAHVGAAARREQPEVALHVLVDPAKALRRQRRAGRADRPQRAQVEVASRGSTPAFSQLDSNPALRPCSVIRGALGERPERAQVRVSGAAVVEHDRRLAEQAADEEVPHHPAGRREPEHPIAARAGPGAGPS